MLAVATLLAGAGSCSEQTVPIAGLSIVLDSDSSLASIDSLQVRVQAADGRTSLKAGPYDKVFRIPADARLPASLAVRSNGDESAVVALDVSVWQNEKPLDVRSYRITNIPSSGVAAFRVLFSARCTAHALLSKDGRAQSDCPVNSTCNPENGQCESNWRDHFENPLPPRDASVEEADSGASDASSDGVAEASEAGTSCALNQTRCTGNIVQVCDGDGQWRDQSACESANQHCFAGSCAGVPPSCQAAPDGGGPVRGAAFDCRVTESRTGDCCASDEIPAGLFERSAEDGSFGDPARVSRFYLDDYEVTVGRFRQFVNAVVDGGWRPPDGSGKHVHLNGGNGLRNAIATAPAFETGWDPSWNVHLSSSRSDWNTNLSFSVYSTWTPFADENESLPINCVSWFEAYAFCIWDGGFLPSEAEWGYAAAAGAEERAFPWGSTEPGASNVYAIYACLYASGKCGALQDVAPVGTASAGRAKWGQWDLAGGLYEWALDWEGPYTAPCEDCARLTGTGARVDRGGSFYDETVQYLHGLARHFDYPRTGYPNVGVRCARAP